MMRPLLASSLLALVVLAACHSSQNASTSSSSTPASSAQSSAGQNFKVYKLRGKVVSTDAAKGEVTLNAEAIPGLMEAMTMPYKLKDATILGKLHPGDAITADVLISQNADADTLLDHIVVVTQAKPE
jgi:protein SCO1/2